MDMLRFAVAVVLWVAGVDASGKCKIYRAYQARPGLRALATQLVRPVINYPLQIPVQYRCMVKCNTEGTCKAFQVVRNETCELVTSFMNAVAVDNETTLYTVDGLSMCPHGFDCRLHPEGLVPSCYKFVLQSMNWTASRDFCRSFGGDLVSIESEEEQLHIQNMIGNDPNLRLTGSNGYWTSGSNETGTWIWKAAGLKLMYQNWHPGEPNGDDGGLWIGHLGHYKWDDVPRDKLIFPLCEIGALF